MLETLDEPAPSLTNGTSNALGDYEFAAGVSAALAASVAANLHRYNAQFCTPASTEILQNRARRKWRKCPRMAYLPNAP